MIDDAIEHHETLVGRIRRRHARLYRDPDLVKSIDRGYLESEVDRPMLNLSRSDQYGQIDTGRAQFLTIIGRAPKLDLFEDARALVEASAVYGPPTQLHLISIAEGSNSGSIPLGEFSSHTYCLPHFLPPYAWEEFIENYIRTRGISTILLWNNDIGFGFLPKLRAESSNLSVVELVDVSIIAPRDVALRGYSDSVDKYLVADQAGKEALAAAGVDRKRIQLLQ